MNCSLVPQANTFFLTNMAPQIPAFNDGIWSRLERLVRDCAKVNMLTGSVLATVAARITAAAE